MNSNNEYSNNKNDNNDDMKIKSKKNKDVLNSIDECTCLIEKIKSLILLFEEKNNKKECPKKKIQNELNKESNNAIANSAVATEIENLASQQTQVMFIAWGEDD
jgi:hypothetical protein